MTIIHQIIVDMSTSQTNVFVAQAPDLDPPNMQWEVDGSLGPLSGEASPDNSITQSLHASISNLTPGATLVITGLAEAITAGYLSAIEMKDSSLSVVAPISTSPMTYACTGDTLNLYGSVMFAAPSTTFTLQWAVGEPHTDPFWTDFVGAAFELS